MSERPITEEELVEMEGYAGSLYARAASAIRRLRATNQRLNRRCQEAESTVKQNDYWSRGFNAGYDCTQENEDSAVARDARRAMQKQGAKNTKLKADNTRLREALKPLEFCAEARGDHWCPSCRGNKQEGSPTRGHYAHCPVYAALKEPGQEKQGG